MIPGGSNEAAVLDLFDRGWAGNITALSRGL